MINNMLLMLENTHSILALGLLAISLLGTAFYASHKRSLRKTRDLIHHGPALWCDVLNDKIIGMHPELIKLTNSSIPCHINEFAHDWLSETSDHSDTFSSLHKTEITHKDSQKVFQMNRQSIGSQRYFLWFQEITEYKNQNLIEHLHAEKSNQRALKLEGILDSLPLFVWETDTKNDIIYANKTYRDALESSGDDNLFDKNTCDKNIEITRTEQHPQEATLQTVIGNERRTCRVTHKLVKTTGSVLSVGMDMTKELSSQSLMTKTLDSYKGVLDKIGLSIAMYGPDTRLEYYNRAYVEMNDLDHKWLQTKPSLGEILESLRKERKLPEVVDFQDYKRQRLLDFKDLVTPREELIHLPDERTLRVHSYPHPTGGIIFVFEDVTGRLQLERLNHALTTVQNTAFENLFEAVAVIGSDSRLKLYNQHFIDLWNLETQEISKGAHINELIEAIKSLIAKKGDDWESMKARIHENLMDRIPKDGEIYRTDGSVLSFAYIPLPNGDHLLSYIDITDTKRITQTLEEKNAALESADKLKSEFIANMSYELRAPLNTLVGFSEILSQQYFGELNSKQQEYVNGILTSSNKLLHMINDILDLASIEAGYLTLSPQKSIVHDLLDDLRQMTEKRAKQAGLNIHIRVANLQKPHWHMDGRRIKQALFRVISNAIKFTPSGGEIHIEVSEQNNHLVFEVTDNGIGMSADEKRDIFKKFHKTQAAQEKDGTGLGLSLVKNLIELHKGKVKVSSQKDKGTTVRCIIPSLNDQATDDSEAA